MKAYLPIFKKKSYALNFTGQKRVIYSNDNSKKLQKNDYLN